MFFWFRKGSTALSGGCFEPSLNHLIFLKTVSQHLHLSTPFSGFDLRIRFGLHLWSWLGPGKVTLLIQFLQNLYAVATCCKAKARWFCIQPPVVPLEGRVVPLSLPGRPEPLSYDAFDSCSKIGEAISLRLMPPAFAGLEIASSMARSTTKSSSSNNSTILSIASSMARSTTKSNSNSSNNQQQQ